MDIQMVRKEKTVQVACCVTPSGDVAFMPNDQTSINTVMARWRATLSEEQQAEHAEAKTIGGVVLVTMLSSEYHAMKKELIQNGAAERT
jgi:hypothetical protein